MGTTHHKCRECGAYFPELGQVSGAHYSPDNVICFGLALDCVCGHAVTSHYNVREGARDTRTGKPRGRPCHHLGKHDMRCACRDYQPAP